MGIPHLPSFSTLHLHLFILILHLHLPISTLSVLNGDSSPSILFHLPSKLFPSSIRIPHLPSSIFTSHLHPPPSTFQPLVWRITQFSWMEIPSKTPSQWFTVTLQCLNLLLAEHKSCQSGELNTKRKGMTRKATCDWKTMRYSVWAEDGWCYLSGLLVQDSSTRWEPNTHF